MDISPWQPPAEAKLHNDTPMPQSMDFFAPPPEEIGQVVTACSTLRVGQQPRPWLKRSLIILAVMVPVGLLLGAIAASEPQANAQSIMGMGVSGAMFIGVPVGLVVSLLFRFTHHVSYVGELGLARITIKRRDKIKKRETFLFADAVDLYTSQTRQYYNGVYVGTRYQYQWKDAAGKRVFQLKGSYNSSKGTPKALSPYYFAASAERAWSILLLRIVAQELEEQGETVFRVNARDSVKIGPGFMEFHMGGKQQRIEREEIGKISMNGGQFRIQHQDSKWFSGQGKFSFAYGNMANARLFLLCLDKLCGYRFEG